MESALLVDDGYGGMVEYDFASDEGLREVIDQLRTLADIVEDLYYGGGKEVIL